jgi:hypothetical protein
MSELILGGAPSVLPRRPRGFWRRQFDDAPTPAQLKFDVAFGLVMPVLCLYFDPVVFKGWFETDRGIYGRYQLYAYTISAVEMVALCAWLFAARRGGGRAAVLAGMLSAGAAFAFLVGLAILPFSVFGLLLLIGVFGFVPFLTGVVYLRNAWRASASLGPAGQPALAAAFALGFVFALGAPVVTQMSDAREVPASSGWPTVLDD